MNASASWFTSYERSLLKTDYGTQRQRLTRDHSKLIDSCCLCLQRAREPVCCASHGDVFCRECAINNLLAQRKEIKRLQAEIERRHAEEEEHRVTLEKEAMDRGVKEFEQIQMGLEGRKKRKIGLDENGSNDTVGKRRKSEGGSDEVDRPAVGHMVKNHGFALDEHELLRIAKSDRERHKDVLTDERAQSSVPKLPSFWIPSLTPSLSSAETAIRKPPKLQPVCPASDPNQHHYYSLKTLVALNFEVEREEKNKHGEEMRICPSCRKALTNEAKAMVAKPCGHVICKPCAQKFVLNNDDPHEKARKRRCFVCEIDLTESKREKDKDKEKEKIRPGIVQIASDGTGYSGGGGRVLAEREGIAFQC